MTDNVVEGEKGGGNGEQNDTCTGKRKIPTVGMREGYG